MDKQICEIKSQDQKAKKNIVINWSKVLEYSLPAIISIAIILFAMIVKGIAPFGTNSIGYIDFNDGLVPAYTQLWDLFHGNGNIFVDWDLGAGGSVITSFVINSFLSPISWLIAIFPREQIIYGISLLVIIKFALMATTSYICFKKFFPNVNKWLILLFSLVWTFSGWSMVHYTNIGWLDIMILLPLFILAMRKLVLYGKITWATIILTYMLMLSYYISYMVLVGVVVIATVYICTLAKDKKKVASLIFWTILISILISMVAFIPSCLISLQAHRFESGNVEAGLFDYFFSKLIVLFMTALPAVFFGRLMLTYKKDKKVVLFFMLSFIICSIGILIEPINEMWHTGSFYSFPFRYSFILILLLIFGALYYIEKYKSNVKDENEIVKAEKPSARLLLILIPSLICLTVLTIVLAIFGMRLIPYNKANFAEFILYFLFFILTYISIECMLRLKNKKLILGKLSGGVLIFALCLVQIVCLSVGYFGTNYDSNNERVTNVFNIETSALAEGYKIKDRETLYNHNFGYMIDYPTLSTWIHISSEEQFVGHNSLGYNSSSTILFSSGGTMLTDMLLGNKYILSREELDTNYYTLLDEFDYVATEYVLNAGQIENEKQDQKVYLYEYNFDIGMAYATNVDLSKLTLDKGYVENQNILFKALYNTEENVMFEISQDAITITQTDTGYKVDVEVPVGENIYFESDSNLFNAELIVNGYTRTVYSGLNDLGISKENIISFEIVDENNEYSLEDIQNAFKFSFFNVDRFISYHNNYEILQLQLIQDGKSLRIEVNNDNYNYLFIPYINLANMNGFLNGDAVTVSGALSAYMQVNIEDGENVVVVTYQPKYVDLCLIVTLVSLLIFIIFAILNWRFNIASNKYVIWIGFIGSCVVLGAVGILVYIKPFFYDFFLRIFT